MFLVLKFEYTPLKQNKLFFMFFCCLLQEKALAEKNRRDLLAQKEQAERNVNFFFLKEFLAMNVKA